MMQTIHDKFAMNLVRAKDLISLFTHLKSITTNVLDLTDILRASVVLSVSALDHYVHEIVRVGVAEAYNNSRTKTDAFNRLSISMESILAGQLSPGNLQWLEDEIRKQHGWLSFQNADKIADAIRLISDKKLWEEVGVVIGTDAKSVKVQLNLIVDRRNKIAHEADMDPSNPGAKWPINEIDARESLETIDRIGHAIFHVVTTP